MPGYKLTKSTVTYGRQCLKRLYLHANHKRLGVEQDAPAPGGGLAARLELGTRVGLLAQSIFPGGVDCSPSNRASGSGGRDYSEAVASTTSRIADGTTSVLYEASFQSDLVFVALDILVRKEDGWHGYEVKSTKSVESQHITDAAIQWWVIEQSGLLSLTSMNIIHLNGDFVLDAGPMDVHKLFAFTDVTSRVQALKAEVAAAVQEQLACLDVEDVPAVRIGRQCSSPYPCSFMSHCWRQAGVPAYSVLNLSRGGAKSWKLFYEGVARIDDIDEGTPLSPAQRLQVQCERTQLPHVDVPAISEFVSSISYPIYYLDFETIAPPVPLFENSRCYQAIPFQYSLHVQTDPFSELDGASGEVAPAVFHKQFLGDGSQEDPRLPLLEQLMSELGEGGSVMVYNLSFEDSRLKEMAIDFPKFAERIALVRERLVDLAIPFSKKYYYTPAMKGKYSIKQVLPAMCPEYASSYKDLDIQEGMAASNTYLAMAMGTYKEDREAALQALLEYCKLDTLAMVKVFQRLHAVCAAGGVDTADCSTEEVLVPKRLADDML
jgi:hypothetical protein